MYETMPASLTLPAATRKTPHSGFSGRHTAFLILKLLILWSVITPAPANAAYYLSKVSNHPEKIGVRMTLPSSRHELKLAPRGVGWGLVSQVSHPSCKGKLLKQSAEGEWISPAGCKEIYWTVDLPDSVNNDYLASRQQSIHLSKPGWSLLSEPSSLLRIKGDKSTSFIKSADPAIRLIGAKKLKGGKWQIPSESSAPEFFVINTSKVKCTQLNGLDVNYIADNAEMVEKLQLSDMHAKVLGALSDMLQLINKLRNHRESLLVVWIGIDKRLRGINGAAGHRSFIANYIIEDGLDEPINRYRAMLLMAHEQFHQLVDMTRTRNNSLPAWVSESLAQYYAIHVLTKINDTPETQRIKSAFIKPEQDYKFGLLELERKNQAGDRSLYHLFYEQGATFWQAIDEVLRENKDFHEGLDSVINDLLSMDFPQDGSLPPDFVKALQRANKKKIDDLLSRYVGT